jgi:hypothetical protein
MLFINIIPSRFLSERVASESVLIKVVVLTVLCVRQLDGHVGRFLLRHGTDRWTVEETVQQTGSKVLSISSCPLAFSAIRLLQSLLLIDIMSFIVLKVSSISSFVEFSITPYPFHPSSSMSPPFPRVSRPSFGSTAHWHSSLRPS